MSFKKKNTPLFIKDRADTKYSYAAQDQSICCEFIYKCFVYPFLELLPYQIPANIITIISNSLVSLAFVIAMQSEKGNYHLWFAIPVLILCYVIGDYSDGEQARRSKTSSPLGEFLDHFLDTFVTGQLLISLLVVYNVKNPAIVAISLTIAYFAQAVAFWERYKVGKMYFAKFSSTESIFSLTILITIGYFKEVRAFAAKPVMEILPFTASFFSKFETGNCFSVSYLVLVFLSFAAASSVIATLIRTRGASVRFILYMVVSAVVALLASIMHESNLHLPYYTIVLFNVNYIASLLSSIVMKQKDHYPDFILAILMYVMLILKIQHPLLTAFYFLYVLVLVGIRASMFFVQNKQYWVWVNPELPKDE